MSSTSRIRFPIVCPACQQESLFQASRAVILEALLFARAIVLHAECHGRWVACDREIEQIKQYAFCEAVWGGV
jgi:antirestriction protein